MRYKMEMDPAAALGGLLEIPPAHPPGNSLKPDSRPQR